MFETDRLVLRSYKDSDMDILIESMSDYRVQVLDSFGFVAPRTPKFAERFKGIIARAFFHVILETKDTQEYVGFILLMAPDHFSKNRNAELGISLAAQHWDKGYGSEALRFVVDYAFRGLGVHRLSLGVFGGNERAVKVYERIGFVKEATIRKCNWVEGEWRDITHMGILEEEWRARRLQATENPGES